jgi:hypothetical protein
MATLGSFPPSRALGERLGVGRGGKPSVGIYWWPGGSQGENGCLGLSLEEQGALTAQTYS